MAFVVIALAASCKRVPQATSCKVDTDDDVVAAMQRTGTVFDRDQFVRHPAHFPELVVIGSYEADAGDIFSNELWGPRCAVVGFGDPGVQTEALKAAGWDTADSSVRAKLALAWLAEVEQIAVLTELPHGWESVPALKQRFSPPKTKVLSDGSIELLFWANQVQVSAAGTSITVRYADFTFTPDGRQRGGITAEGL